VGAVEAACGSAARSNRLDLPHHERIEDDVFRRAVGRVDAGDVEGLRGMLLEHPRLVHQHVAFEGGNYFRSPSLLEFVAENPVRHGKLPANIVDVARVLLEAGADMASRNEALMLVATGSVVRKCGVQRALIGLLCEYGADPNSAVRSAAVLNEHDAALALLERGARMDLAVAAALGRVREFEHLVGTASADERQVAFALAAQFGHSAMVRALLDAGVDLDRYIVGGHSHSTPLHQAAAAGHLEIVKMLVERGARLDLKDVLWQGTPEDWAAHEGRVEVEKYLRARREERAEQAKQNIARGTGRE
jgi:ankyrin repeat protein